MIIGVKLFTHSDADPEIKSYTRLVKDVCLQLNLSLDEVDIAEDPVQAIREHVHSVPTLVFDMSGIDPVYRVGTAPYDLLIETMERYSLGENIGRYA